MERPRSIQDTGTGIHYPHFELAGLICLGLVLFPAGVVKSQTTWTGLGGTDNWSEAANWSAGVPDLGDLVTFNTADSGNGNVVDGAFTVANLRYVDNSVNTTDFTPDSGVAGSLHIRGDLRVGYGGGTDTTATWTEGGTVTFGTSNLPGRIVVGDSWTSKSTTKGSFTLDGPDVGGYFSHLWIGLNGSTGSAVGHLTVGDDSTLQVGTSEKPATSVQVGYNGSGPGGSSTGFFDASKGTVTLYANDLSVGYNYSGSGTSTGTLVWDQQEPIHALGVHFAEGPGTQGILDVPAGGTFLLGTETDPLEQWRIAYNGASSGLASANLDFTLTDPTVEAHIANGLWIGIAATLLNPSTGQADGGLTLGDNSKVYVGTPTRPGNLWIGWTESPSGTTASGTGLLDATRGDMDVYVNDLTVGHNTGFNGGTATGTLRWNQPDPIHATNVDFGRGAGATGILEVPAGGTFLLGTPDDPIETFRIGYNTSGNGAGSTTLDFTVTDPTFEAYIHDYVAIGMNVYASGQPEGQLILGDNSKMHLGTPTIASPFVGVGYNGTATAESKAQGVLDASRGQIDFHVTSVYVGYNLHDTAGSSTGVFTLGDRSVVTALEVRLGGGPNTSGIINLNGGILAADRIHMGAGGTFNLTDGRLAVNTFNTFGGGGVFEQDGGVLAPGFSRALTPLAGVSTINGNYVLNTGTLEIELFGKRAGNQYDQLWVNGLVTLNGVLDLDLLFAPTLGDEFLILNNDDEDLIFGHFAGLEQGDWFSEMFGGTRYWFSIDYFGFTGNDVVLTVGEHVVPVPGALVLGSLGLGFSGWLTRRQRRGA